LGRIVNSSKEIRLKRFKTLGYDLIFNCGGENNQMSQVRQKANIAVT
jgi:hypothetical protein